MVFLRQSGLTRTFLEMNNYDFACTCNSLADEKTFSTASNGYIMNECYQSDR